MEVTIDEDITLVLEGRVLELFWRGRTPSGKSRWHVDHVGVDAKQTGDGGFEVKIGDRDGDDIFGAVRFSVSPEASEGFQEFFEAAKAARSG